MRPINRALHIPLLAGIDVDLALMLGLMYPAQPTRYIRAVEAALGRQAKMEMLGLQMGDVRATSADISRLEAWVGFRPQTKVEEGIAKFVAWYREYYGV